MAYIGNSPTNIVRGRRAVYEYTATAGQTVFTGVDNNGLSLDLLEANENDVYLNGSRLVLNDDYTVSGDTLTLISAAELNDILIIVTQDEVANAGSYTKAESDTRYINYNGDIVNGDIQVVGTITADSLVMTQSGTVDGRDIAADGTKLDGIEANADVTDTANVAAAGALMTTGGTMTGAITSEIELGAIAKDISDTAVDVFIYDTRKDSDGGAWRKRTQHTSWYNETLNTATRGSRKEFPAVAVIVAESNQVTIYDGDDPDMPMWMVFNAPDTDPATYAIVKSSGQSISSATALNGTIATSVSYNGLFYQNFVSDDCFRVNTTNTVQGGNIYSRNGGMSFSNTVGNGGLVHATVYDVAMTVLPNAPIDATTGLPVPTIAAATNGGVSVIKDDGTVVDLTDSAGGQSTKVMFTQDGKLAYAHDGATSIRIDSIPAADFVYGSNKVSRGNSEEFYINSGLISSGWSGETPKILEGSFAHKGIIVKSDPGFGLAQTGSKGLTRLDRSLGEGGKARNMVQYTTSDYNTGWMNGDIKLATLSDTDATDLTPPPELITNGTFNSDVSGWSNDPTEILTWNSSGYAQVDRNGGSSQGQCYQNITTEVGKAYIIKVDIIAVSHGFQVYAAQASIPSSSGSNVANTTGTFYWWFTASSTTTRIDLSAVQSSAGTASFDNVSVKLAEVDRSVNGKGLQVFGTVTKSAVATGADLVAYSGFSSSNYLRQPYNPDLNFGTGDWAINCWFKITAATNTAVMFSWRNVGGQTPFWQVYQTNTTINFDLSDGTGGGMSISTTYRDDQWHMLTFLARGPNLREAWVDGKLIGSNTTTLSTGVTGGASHELRVGTHYDGLYSYTGSLALLRISATAPTPEQITKMYNDEKFLFQENAKATLYGSSDAVTALAYDDDTELLHVGTSAGRSVFQGLRRIDNTTDAVGAAISASNGMVAED